MGKEQRIVHDYYRGGQLIFRIGYAKNQETNAPLALHDHGNMMEFTFIEKGTQFYQVAGKKFEISAGECFLTYPNEPHSAEKNSAESTSLYYLIVDLSLARALNTFLLPENYA